MRRVLRKALAALALVLVALFALLFTATRWLVPERRE